MKNLEDLKHNVKSLLKQKNIPLSHSQKEKLFDNIKNSGTLFKDCLTKVNEYVYHSFYFLFFFSLIGLSLSFIDDLNIFQLSLSSNNLEFLIGVIYLLTIITLYFYQIKISWLYFYARCAFVLILYTKIDYEYLERITKKYDDSFNYESILKMEDKKNINFASHFKIILLSVLLFPIFFVWNKKFKQFFYAYYQL